MTIALSDLTTAQLVQAYNMIADKPTKKFADRKSALVRTAKALDARGLEVKSVNDEGIALGAQEGIDPAMAEVLNPKTTDDMTLSEIAEHTSDHSGQTDDGPVLEPTMAERHATELAALKAEMAGRSLAEQADAAKSLRLRHEAERAAAPAPRTEKRAKADKKPSGGKRGPAPEYADDDRIVLNIAGGKNPKKPGTAAHARFALYEDGMTVGAYLAAGGQRSDLRWDAARGFIASYTARQWANSAAGRDMEDDGDAQVDA